MKYYLFIRIYRLTFLFIPIGLSAQNKVSKETKFSTHVAALFANQEENLLSEDLYEFLWQSYQNPLDLNRADKETLGALYILSPRQIQALLKHKNKYGPLLSVYELQAIDGFDQETINKLLPFVKIRRDTFLPDSRHLFQRIQETNNHYIVTNLESRLKKSKGYLTPVYKGSPLHYSLRYRLRSTKDYSIGLTAEKDPGEQFRWQPTKKQYGFDFLSFHAAVFHKKNIKTALIGDYQLQLGQGLLFSGGFQIGKGSETVTTLRKAQLGILPYTSAQENNFLRGAAITYTFKNLSLTGFYSNKLQDARVKRNETDTLMPEAFITSSQNSGLHRTEQELSNKGAVKEQSFGTNWQYNNKKQSLSLGVTGLYTQWNIPIVQSKELYKIFDFQGSNNWNIGANFSFNLENFSVFGEAAMSKSKGIGLVLGLLGNLSVTTQLSVLYRNYARNFHSFYGRAFGENSRNTNESGLYMGIKIQPIHRLTFSAFYDYFNFPWLKFGVNAPSKGSEYLMRLSYQPNKNLLFYMQYRVKTKEENAPSNNQLKNIIPTIKKNYLFHTNYAINKILSFSTRFQMTKFSTQQSSMGYAAIQNIDIRLHRLYISVRYMIFDTDNYDTRQYTYEKDILYAFSFPAYDSQGSRYYLLLKYAFSPKINLRFKYAVSRYVNRDTIGSGNDTVAGNMQQQVKLQVQVKL